MGGPLLASQVLLGKHLYCLYCCTLVATFYTSIFTLFSRPRPSYCLGKAPITTQDDPRTGHPATIDHPYPPYCLSLVFQGLGKRQLGDGSPTPVNMRETTKRPTRKKDARGQVTQLLVRFIFCLSTVSRPHLAHIMAHMGPICCRRPSGIRKGKRSQPSCSVLSRSIFFFFLFFFHFLVPPLWPPSGISEPTTSIFHFPRSCLCYSVPIIAFFSAGAA
jgi:hypothetical protein